MPEIEVTGAGGVRLAAFSDGDPAAPTVLLVHGFPDTHAVWNRVAAALATAHPERGVSVMTTSSGDRVSVSPSTATLADPPSLKAAANPAASAAVIAPATALVLAPKRLPRARKFALAA